MVNARKFILSLVELITMPEVYRKIRRLMASPKTTLDDYVDVINSDPSLATRLIRIANTSFFGYSRKADTLEQAISLIGIMQVHDVLLCSLAMRTIAGIPNEIVNLSAFWENSVHCGIISRVLARKCSLLTSHQLFTLGLFHDIGHVIMYAKTPELAQEALMLAQQESESIFIVERKLFGFDYGQLGCELMRLWHLPPIYQKVTEQHMEPERAVHYPLETALVHLAHGMIQGDNNNDGSDGRALFSPQSFELTRLKEADLGLVRAEAQKSIQEVLNSLWPFAEHPDKDNYNKPQGFSSEG